MYIYIYIYIYYTCYIYYIVHSLRVRSRVSKSRLKAELCFHRYVPFSCVPCDISYIYTHIIYIMHLFMYNSQRFENRFILVNNLETLFITIICAVRKLQCFSESSQRSNRCVLPYKDSALLNN